GPGGEDPPAQRHADLRRALAAGHVGTLSNGTADMTPGPAATPVIGRRERQKLATTVALREAALRLALRDGIDNITVEQITAEADVHLRTFFNHFSSKEEAVMAISDDYATALVTEVRDRPP